jgi:KipI family sensor histidine kinase inhibitor
MLIMHKTASTQPVRLSNLGENALLLDAATNALTQGIQEKIWDLAGTVEQWPDIREVVPGMNNLLIIFDSLRLDPAELESKLLQAWRHARGGARTGRTIEIPVHYGGEAGVDLAYVADQRGLSIEEVIELHSVGEYTVYAIGSQPGFGYLAGLNSRLATPRRTVPRTRVEAGSVMIGGAQAGVMSCTSPSGWHVVGRTDVCLFDPARSPPVLLTPGDRIRFRVESVKPC